MRQRKPYSQPTDSERLSLGYFLLRQSDDSITPAERHGRKLPPFTNRVGNIETLQSHLAEELNPKGVLEQGLFNQARYEKSSRRTIH